MSQSGANQKLQKRTDENHSVTMPEIIAALAGYDVRAERKINMFANMLEDDSLNWQN